MSVRKRINLHRLAEAQDGFFTAKQAAEAGYRPANFHHFVRSGEWVREGHGLYRLQTFPWSPRQELWKIYMWSRNKHDRPQGVFSFHTALDLYGLSDVLPNKIHLTVPMDFRRRSETPKIVHLHFENLPSTTVRQVHGLPCTIPSKTIIDLVQFGLSDALLKQAFKEASERGLITADELENYEVEPAAARKLRSLAIA
jgi:predicted transcriptional regulator of viral defense system